MTFGRKLLAVPLALLSIVLNGVSGLVWSFNGKPDDEGHWEAGMRQGFGLFGPEVDNQIGNVLSEPWKRKDHFIKKITHVWLQAHTKRANKVYSLVIVVLGLAVVALIWRPWRYFGG